MIEPNRLLLCITLLVCNAAYCADSAGKQTLPDAKPYRVVDGKVDRATFLGWRAFHSGCHACHGVDAVGTSVAPNLVERIRHLSARDFSIKVLTSYRLVFQSGEAMSDDQTAVREKFLEEVLRRESGQLIMPAWEQDTKMQPHLLDLYAYLRARGDGALGQGKPQPIAE